jgi:hypothetical protein
MFNLHLKDAGVETTGSTWKYAGRKTLELDQKFVQYLLCLL